MNFARNWKKQDVMNHDVIRKGKVVIPEGATGAEISYRTAPWTYVNKEGKTVRGNQYRYNGVIY